MNKSIEMAGLVAEFMIGLLIVGISFYGILSKMDAAFSVFLIAASTQSKAPKDSGGIRWIFTFSHGLALAWLP